MQNLYLSAFPEHERGLVSKLAVDLLAEETVPPTISLAAEADGAIVGHVAFSPVTFPEARDDSLAYILAPLAVAPAYQKRGIGSHLVKSGIQRLVPLGAALLFVYGDPNYYSRFGFSARAAEDFIPPYPLLYPFGWQALALNNSPQKGTPKKITCVQSLNHPALW